MNKINIFYLFFAATFLMSNASDVPPRGVPVLIVAVLVAVQEPVKNSRNYVDVLPNVLPKQKILNQKTGRFSHFRSGPTTKHPLATHTSSRYGGR